MINKSFKSTKPKKQSVPRQLLVKSESKPLFKLPVLKDIQAWQAVGTVFTGSSTVYLGRYCNLVFPEKFLTNGATGQQGYAGRFNSGRYKAYVVKKIHIKFHLQNLETTNLMVGFLELPTGQSISTDTALDLISNSTRKIQLGPAGVPNATKTFSVSVDLPKLNHMSDQTYCDNPAYWSTYGSSTSNVSYGYIQFLKGDNGAFANGVDVRVDLSYEIQPMTNNVLLGV